MEELQDLAGKIEEIKEKLTDEEYKDLLELSHKYYDKEVIKKEKAKKKKFMKVLCVSSSLITHINLKGEGEDKNDLIHTDHSQMNYEYDIEEYDGIETIRTLNIKCLLKQFDKIILFEVKTRDQVSGYYIDMKNCIMTETAYTKLMDDRYEHQGPCGCEGMCCDSSEITFVYISHFEI
jgi:hypothetical protein